MFLPWCSNLDTLRVTSEAWLLFGDGLLLRLGDRCV